MTEFVPGRARTMSGPMALGAALVLVAGTAGVAQAVPGQVPHGARDTGAFSSTRAFAAPTQARNVPSIPAGTTRGSTPWTTSWTGAWTASPQRLVDSPDFSGTTLRLLMHPTIGGSGLRIRLANTFGDEQQTFTAVNVAVAVSASTAELVPGTSRPVLFGKRATTTVAAGGKTVSDPLDLPVRYGQTLAVDLTVPSAPRTVTGHASANQVSFLARGEHAGEETAEAFDTQLSSWYWLNGLDVGRTASGRGSIVALGDSITDGAYATWNGNRRWTDDLAERLQKLPAQRRHGVLNAGIGGNQVLRYRGDCCGTSESALARLDRDVLAQTDARWAVVVDGINDIGGANPEPEELIEGLRQIAVQSHDAGLKVALATITPYGCDSGCFDPARERNRQTVNEWIRTTDQAQAVLDFDRALRDPKATDHLLPTYDSGDHLHPNTDGYQAMADSIDLRIFR
ncbi:MAG: hypothetical protein QG608_2841 [Actinomycetota bacterium]|nr:hypothetical protein [Actinomycetota bacterium]